MLKQKIRKIEKFRVAAIAAVALVILAAVPTRGFGAFAATCSSSSDCQSQINALSSQNDQAQANLSALMAQASSYQDAINKLEAQINDMQQQIVATQNQENDVQAQIDQAQAQLNHEIQVLGQSIRTMYIEGDPSVLTALASSKNLSDFVDKQQYHYAVQSKIKQIADKVQSLKAQLEFKKNQLEQLHTSLSAQQSQLQATENQQANLLSYNEGQQANFNNQIAANKDQIAQLRRQQAAMIQAGTRSVIPPPSSGSGGACDNGNGNGGYPMSWCDAYMDSIATIPYSRDTINRECTSYAYWYFTQMEGYSDFRAYGNANQWAATSNYPVHSSPARGAIAVETTGYYGHVAIVQGLPGDSYWGGTVPDGYVLVSEMNYDWGGHFRYSFSPLSKFSDYIY